MATLSLSQLSTERMLARVLFVVLLGSLVGLSVVTLGGQTRLSPMLAFAIPVGLACLFLMITRFEWMLIILMATRASIDPLLELIKGGAEGMGPGAVINVLVILVGVVYALLRPRAFARPHLLLWVVFLALAASATRYAPDFTKALRMLMVYSTYFVMFALPAVVIKDRASARFWVRVLLVASIVPTIGGVIDLATGGVKVAEPEWIAAAGAIGMPEYSGFRIQGVFGHPNIFAFYLVTLLGTLLYALTLGMFSHRRRPLGYAYLALQIVLLLATQTRGAWAAAAVVLLCYGVFIDRRMLIWIALGCVPLVFVPVVQDRVAEIFVGRAAVVDDSLNSYEWRLAMWRSALPWIEDRWLLGWGLDAYTGYSNIFFPLEYLVGFDAHNVYVQLAFEMGVPGAIAFAAIFVGLIVLALIWGRRRRIEAVLLASQALAYLAVCYSDNMHRYLVSNWYAFFFMGLLAVRVLRSEADDASAPADT